MKKIILKAQKKALDIWNKGEPTSFLDKVRADGETIDEHGIIRDNGKFEGDWYPVLYFYELMMLGDGEDIENGSGDGYCIFTINQNDVKSFPELTGKEAFKVGDKVAVVWNDQGFVWLDTDLTEAEIQELREECDPENYEDTYGLKGSKQKGSSKKAGTIQTEDSTGKPISIENPYYDIPGLCADTVNDIHTYDIKDLRDPDNPDQYLIIVDTIVSENYGPDGPTHVLSQLGLIPGGPVDVDAEDESEERETEFDAEMMEDVYNDIADDINAQKTISGQFIATWWEGGFYLMYMFTDEDIAADFKLQQSLPFKGNKQIVLSKKKTAELENLWADTEEIEVRVLGSFVAGERSTRDYPGASALIEDLRVEFYLGKEWVDVTKLLDQDALGRYEDFALKQVEENNRNG